MRPHHFVSPATVPWAGLAAPAVFLGGSIEQGSADLWQPRASARLLSAGLHVVDPRRATWDSSWPQDPSFVEFRRQVEWELTGLERADAVLMHLCARTISPVSLLELGLCCERVRRDGPRLVVSCEPGFHRRGNVLLTTGRYDVPCFDGLDDAIDHLLTVL